MNFIILIVCEIFLFSTKGSGVCNDNLKNSHRLKTAQYLMRLFAENFFVVDGFSNKTAG